MYEKVIPFIGVIMLLFTSCISSDHAEAGGRDLVILGRIEQSIDEFDRRVERAEELSSGITDTVQRLRSLFAEYSSAVTQLRSELEALRTEIEYAKEDNSSGSDIRTILPSD